VISGLLYIATTLTLLVAVSKNEINVLQGIVQAVSHMAQKVGVVWIVAPFAFMLSISIAGIGSAWLAGSARIPFVAGLDSYLPSWLGKVHPRYGTPYAALIVHFVVSTILVLISFLGSGVQETFQRLLSLAVVLQLLPFLYMFAALLKIAADPMWEKGHYSKAVLWLSGSSGLLMTILGMIFAFSPAQQIRSVWSYEAWMLGGTALFIGLAVFFFFVYGRRKTAAQAAGRI
jgi:amino acid transporter